MDEPVPIHSAPLFPYLAVPELNDSFPLEPVAPEFAVDIDILPELVVVPSPLRTKTYHLKTDITSGLQAQKPP